MKGKHQTANEILKAYNEYIRTKAKEIGYKKIKKPTLYKYLSELEEQGLVAKTGKRAIIGQTAPKALYSFVAENFFPAAFDITYLDSEVGTNIVKAANEFYPLFPEIKETKLEKTRELFNASFSGILGKFSSLMRDYAEEDISMLDEFDRKELEKFMVISRNMLIVLNPSVYSKQLEKLKEGAK